MSYHLVCTHCKKSNKLGQMFCKHCGARLNPSSAKRKSRFKLGKAIAVLFRVAFLGGLLAVLGLMLWKVDPVGQEGSERHAKAFKETVVRLELAMERGYELREGVSESQVNAYLADVVSHTVKEGEPDSLELTISQITISFTEEQFTLHILAQWGPLTLSHEISGVPVSRDGEGFSVELRQVRLGHLPLPSPLKEKMAERVVHVFGDMDREEKLLDGLKEFVLDQQRIFVST